MSIGQKALRLYRLRRLQKLIAPLDVAGVLLADPVNIRYATGVRNMQPWALHSTFRLAFVPTEGEAVCFEYAGSEHLAAGLETVKEVRKATALFRSAYPSLGRQKDVRLAAWAREIADLVRAHGSSRLAIDRHLDHFSAVHLEDEGLQLVGAQPALSKAQSVKSAEEIACIRESVAAAEEGLRRLRDAIEPGRTEISLWAILEGANAELGGEYLDTRLLSSGPRTNPWYQEASERRIEAGDLVAIDTDMIGPHGYDADLSRSFLCGKKASAQQRDLYRTAWEQLQHNLALIRPGAEFRDLSQASFILPERYRAQEMAMVWHGVGLYGQWPTIVAKRFFDAQADQDVIEPGMTLCCESYVGAEGGAEGVKLEEMVLVTETGCELLTAFPFEEALLGRQL
ncbi:MAG: Xaa-Pro peptidase family protein [Rhodovibrionaceae bacterium]